MTPTTPAGLDLSDSLSGAVRASRSVGDWQVVYCQLQARLDAIARNLGIVATILIAFSASSVIFDLQEGTAGAGNLLTFLIQIPIVVCIFWIIYQNNYYGYLRSIAARIEVLTADLVSGEHGLASLVAHDPNAFLWPGSATTGLGRGVRRVMTSAPLAVLVATALLLHYLSLQRFLEASMYGHPTWRRPALVSIDVLLVAAVCLGAATYFVASRKKTRDLKAEVSQVFDELSYQLKATEPQHPQRSRPHESALSDRPVTRRFSHWSLRARPRWPRGWLAFWRFAGRQAKGPK